MAEPDHALKPIVQKGSLSCAVGDYFFGGQRLGAVRCYIIYALYRTINMVSYHAINMVSYCTINMAQNATKMALGTINMAQCTINMVTHPDMISYHTINLVSRRTINLVSYCNLNMALQNKRSTANMIPRHYRKN